MKEGTCLDEDKARDGSKSHRDRSGVLAESSTILLFC